MAQMADTAEKPLKPRGSWPPSVGETPGQLGGIVRGELHIGEDADGTPLALAVTIVTGGRRGPTLWVDGALHGDELDGLGAMWSLLASLDPDRLAGSIVCVTGTNPAAFRAMRRTSPVDDLDLNRVFPGDGRDTHTRQLAEKYLAAVSQTADAYVNLHGGRKTSDVMFYSIYRDRHGRAGEQSRRMAYAVGATTVWRSKDRWLDTSLFDWLTRHDVPSVIIEVGGEGKIRPDNVRRMTAGLVGILEELRILDGGGKPRDPAIIVREADFFYSSAGGIWLSAHSAGDHVRHGDVIGTLHNAYGDVVDQVRCKAAEGVLLSLRTYGATPTGAVLGIVGVVEGDKADTSE